MLDPKSEKWVIIAFYVLLFFGAIWNITGLFSSLMKFLTAPMMITLGLVALLSIPKNQIYSVSIWFVGTAVTTIGVEWLGVETGLIFGNYIYSDLLQPQVFTVPIAIGIAWAGSCLGAFGLMSSLPFLNRYSVYIKAIFIGFLMMIFDVFLEPVAVKLNYWAWSEVMPPLQNYVSWWIIGTIFAFPLLKLMKDSKPSPLAFHSFVAQIIYFSMIVLGSSFR